MNSELSGVLVHAATPFDFTADCRRAATLHTFEASDSPEHLVGQAGHLGELSNGRAGLELPDRHFLHRRVEGAFAFVVALVAGEELSRILGRGVVVAGHSPMVAHGAVLREGQAVGQRKPYFMTTRWPIDWPTRWPTEWSCTEREPQPRRTT